MPYIKQDMRLALDPIVDMIKRTPAMNAGELNYIITVLIKTYIKIHDLNYQRINDVVGALEGAKLEFTRRVTNDYEDSKIKTNGDVYETE